MPPLAGSAYLQLVLLLYPTTFRFADAGMPLLAGSDGDATVGRLGALAVYVITASHDLPLR